jgi:hypothetical protein
VIRWSDVRVEEELAGISEGPVFWEGVFRFLVVLDPLDELLESAMLADELEGSVRTYFGDGVEVIAAKKDTKIDELVLVRTCKRCGEDRALPACDPCQGLPTLSPRRSLEWAPSAAH